MQLGLKFSPDKCEALWYRSNDPDWNLKILRKYSISSISKIPRGHQRQKLNFRKQIDYIRQINDRKVNLLKVLNSLSGVNANILKNIYTAAIQSTLEYGAVTFGMMAPSNIDRLHVSLNQGMRLILEVPRDTTQQTVGKETIAFGLHFASVFPSSDILNGYVTNTEANIYVALSSPPEQSLIHYVFPCSVMVTELPNFSVI